MLVCLSIIKDKCNVNNISPTVPKDTDIREGKNCILQTVSIRNVFDSFPYSEIKKINLPGTPIC